MLFISGEDMEKALEEFQDSEPSLEYRLWHVCANRIATSILMKQTAYQVSPFEQSRSYWADSHWSDACYWLNSLSLGRSCFIC